MATSNVKIYIGPAGEFTEEPTGGGGGRRTYRLVPGSDGLLWPMPPDYVPGHIYRTLTVERRYIDATTYVQDGQTFRIALTI